MGAVRVAFLVLLLAGTVAVAQPVPPGSLGDVLRPILDPAVGTVVPRAENETAQDLHREDVRIDLALDVRDVDYSLLGILFGGGRVAADVDAAVHLEFRAVSSGRLDDALRASSGDANATLNRTFGVPTSRVAITAEEVRLLGAGVLLAAFQEQESDAARAFLERSLPGLAVLGASFVWSNTQPARELMGLRPPDPADVPAELAGLTQPPDRLPVPDLREPPLVLDARFRLQYLDRISLLGTVSSLNGTSNATAVEADLEARQVDSLGQRSAFAVLGFSQLLDFHLPPGWRVQASVRVPQGFTVEGATDAVVVSEDRRSITYALDGLGRATPAGDAALVTLSSRSLVTATLLGATLLVGLALRLPFEAVLLAIPSKADKAMGEGKEGPRQNQRHGKPYGRPDGLRRRKVP